MTNIDRKKLLDQSEPLPPELQARVAPVGGVIFEGAPRSSSTDCGKTHSRAPGYALWSSHDRSDDAHFNLVPCTPTVLTNLPSKLGSMTGENLTMAGA